VPTFTIQIGELGKVLEKTVKQIQKDTDRGLYRAAQRGRTLLVDRSPTGWSGQFRNAWGKPEAIPNGYEVVNNAPHAMIVEYGSRPHMPPVAPIAMWVMRVLGPRLKLELKTARDHGAKLWEKGGTFEATGKGEASTKQGALVKAAMEIAWLIAWKIKKRGTKAQHVAGGAEPELKRFVEEELARAYDEE